MKVKVLSSNLIGADYKPLSFGAEIEVKNAELAELWIKAKLVEEIKGQVSLLIVKVNDEEIDLNKLKVDELLEFAKTHNLNLEKGEKENKADFAKRVYISYTEKE